MIRFVHLTHKQSRSAKSNCCNFTRFFGCTDFDFYQMDQNTNSKTTLEISFRRNKVKVSKFETDTFVLNVVFQQKKATVAISRVFSLYRFWFLPNGPKHKFKDNTGLDKAIKFENTGSNFCFERSFSTRK